MQQLLIDLKKNRFLFEELVKRDFKVKYKRTVFGMAWSILSPLLNLLVLVLVFTKLLGKDTPHYSIYIFCGTLVMSYFRESTRGGMNSLMDNRAIISKINIPKYMFLLSNNVSSLINFALTLSVFFVLSFADGVQFGWHFLMLIFAITCLAVFNIGIGLILSACFVFFRDTGYLYDVLLTLINYLSAVFYRIDTFPITVQRLFLCNPLYCYIHYFRVIVLDGNIPSLQFHLLCLFYAIFFLLIGFWFYKKFNHQFIYYM